MERATVSGETFGAALKRWRERRQLSVRGLATKAHYGKSHISGLENGRVPRPEVAKHLDAILQAGGELVVLADAERIQQQHQVVEAGSFNPRYYANLATQLLLGPEGWNDMQRRTFVFGASGVAGLSLMAPALALETARHGLTLALAEQRADVAVDEWQAVVTEYGYSYQTTPPAELLDLLVVDVLGIQYAIDRQEASRAVAANLRDLRQAGALLAALMAMTVANLGQMHQAARWWRTARRIAAESGDVETVTWVRGREVVRAIYEQRPLGLILRLISDAESYAGGAPARALPELISGKAQALALAGRADEAASALHQLETIYAGLPSEATADRGTVFAWADDRLRFTESFVYSHLGEMQQASIAQEEALAAYPAAYRRGPAQIELQRALCFVRSDDVATGVQHAQAVMAGLSPAEYIRPIFDLSRRVLDAVPIAQQPHSAVIELRDCIAAFDASA
jgi:transcriptional regulator with XRE-family HTH domain